MGKASIERFKEEVKKIKPIVILAQPAHGKHATKKSHRDLQEATEKPALNSWLRNSAEQQTKQNEQGRHLEEHYRKHFDKHDLLSLAKYTASSYGINRHLIKEATGKENRSGVSDNVAKAHAKNIDKVLTTAPPLTQDVHVYHGLKDWHPGMESYKHPHRMIEMPAYTSTSLNKHTAMGFSSDSNIDGSVRRNQHFIHIHLKKGQNPGAYVEGISSTEHEKEFILKRNSKLQIERKPTILKNVGSSFHYGKRKNNPHTYVWHAHYVDEE